MREVELLDGHLEEAEGAVRRLGNRRNFVLFFTQNQLSTRLNSPFCMIFGIKTPLELAARAILYDFWHKNALGIGRAGDFV